MPLVACNPKQTKHVSEILDFTQCCEILVLIWIQEYKNSTRTYYKSKHAAAQKSQKDHYGVPDGITDYKWVILESFESTI